MRIKEIRKCISCGKMYTRNKGGIVVTPKELIDNGMCMVCKTQNARKKIKKITSKHADG